MSNLVTDGASDSTIVWWARSDGATDVVTSFAAAELQSYVRRISGATLPVLRGSIADEPPLDSLTSAIVVTTGDAPDRGQLPSQWLSSIASRVSSLKEDGFALESKEGRIVLAGANPRGTLYAAYALLEQLGVRFFAPRYPFYGDHAEYLPSRSSLPLPALEIIEEPSMKYRRRDFGAGYSHTAATLALLLDWMAKNRLNTLAYPTNVFGLGLANWDDFRESLIPEAQKRGILLEVGGHGYESFLPESTYGEEHPEWFPEDGVPVVGRRPNRRATIFRITNDDALRTYVDNVIAYLRDHPEIDIFDAWPTDGALWVKADVDHFGGISNAEAYVHGRLTEAVQEAGLEVKMEGLSYVPAVDPPDPQYMYGESTLIDFAIYDRSYSEPLFGESYPINAYYNEVLKRWRDSGFQGDTCIYEYYTKYSWHSLPVVLPRLISAEVPYYCKVLGADGIGIYAEAADWITHELTQRLVAALSWNADLDGAAFVKSYLSERYGPAAEEMAAYLDLVEDAGRALYDRVQGNYENLENVSKVREGYLEAKASLDRAARRVEAGSAGAFLVQRLGWNLDYAVADTEISYYHLLQEPDESERARERLQELITRHRFDGVLLDSPFIGRRHLMADRPPTFNDRKEDYDRYREAFGV